MGKNAKKTCKANPTVKKATQNIKSEAKAKNLQFLLVPEKLIRNDNTKENKKKVGRNVKNKPSVVTVSSAKQSLDKPTQSKTEPTSKRETPPPKRRAVRVPLIDIGTDDDHQQLNIRMSLLRDWTSDVESDEPNPSEKDLSDHDSEGNDSSGAGHNPVCALDAENSAAAKKTYSRTVLPKLAGHQSDSANDSSLLPAPAFESSPDLNACVCGQQARIDQLIQENNLLLAQNKKLKRLKEESNTRCLSLTDALNAKVLGTSHDGVFTEVEGFPDRTKLRKFSEAAGSRDYIFVKLVMQEICTEGLRNITTTGRASNNPKGRKGGERSQDMESPSRKIRLDPDKKAYIEERFVEHRRYRGDSISVAGKKSKDCRGLMTRVISYYGKKLFLINID